MRVVVHNSVGGLPLSPFSGPGARATGSWWSCVNPSLALRALITTPILSWPLRVVGLLVTCFLVALPAAAGTAIRSSCAPAHEITIRSSLDGAEQPALFYVPTVTARGERRRALPLLVYLHSWSTTYKQSEGLYEAIRECEKLGWVFIAPNFRGPNNRPEACGSKWAVRDVLDAVAHARQSARVDARRIYLLGSSGGGHMALVMAHQAPGVWAAVSAWVPITDLFAWHDQCKRAGREYAKMIEACCDGPPGTPECDEQYRQRSPIFWLDRAKGLTIDLNAGIQDGHTGSVPIDHTLNAFNVLARANGQASRMLSEGEIREMTRTARVPAHLERERIDEPGRAHRILFRRSAGPVRVTIFDGGHSGDIPTALTWLASQAKKTAPSTTQPSSASKNAYQNGILHHIF